MGLGYLQGIHRSKGSPFFQPRTLGCGTVEVCQEGEDVNLDLLDVPLILHKVNRCVSMTGVFVWVTMKRPLPGQE